MDASGYRTLLPLFETLSGERIVLRPYREEDAAAVFDAVCESREQLDRWIRFARHHQSVDTSRDWIIHRMAEWLLRESCALGMWS